MVTQKVMGIITALAIGLAIITSSGVASAWYYKVSEDGPVNPSKNLFIYGYGTGEHQYYLNVGLYNAVWVFEQHGWTESHTHLKAQANCSNGTHPKAEIVTRSSSWTAVDCNQGGSLQSGKGWVGW